jgi:hypothetical protein
MHRGIHRATRTRPATYQRPAPPESTPTLRGASLGEWLRDAVTVIENILSPTPAPPTVSAHTDIPDNITFHVDD